MSKPVVEFEGSYDFYKVPLFDPQGIYKQYANEEGMVTVARIYQAMNHPILGYEPMIRTSIVINTEIQGDSILIETLNSIYKGKANDQ
jgi:hypothetical protein